MWIWHIIMWNVKNSNNNILDTLRWQNKLLFVYWAIWRVIHIVCIDKASNFIRYIDRFKNSEEVYLSCNFETILANLIKKQDADAFNRIVKSAFEKYKVFHSKLYNAINRWDRNQIKKSVWSNRNMYNTFWRCQGTSAHWYIHFWVYQFLFEARE